VASLIFDFDGTLADSFELAVDIAYSLIDLPPITPAEVERLRRMPMVKAVREMGIPLRHVPRLVLAGRQAMAERIDELKPFPGIAEALQALHQADYHMLIMSSNSEQNVRAFLRNNNLEQYFEGVYGGVGLFNKSAALKKTLRRNGLRAEDCYYIGDEARDVTAAKKVHIRPVAVTWGYQAAETLAEHQPFALVTTPPELVEIFEAERK
jgi:phosphoglycolate phosphatase